MGAGVELEQAEVPVGKATYTVRELTHAEHKAAAAVDRGARVSHICAAGIIGPRRFTPEEVDALPTRVVNRCAERILELSGLSDDEKKD